jgi:hypothetical protein
MNLYVVIRFPTAWYNVKGFTVLNFEVSANIKSWKCLKVLLAKFSSGRGLRSEWNTKYGRQIGLRPEHHILYCDVKSTHAADGTPNMGDDLLYRETLEFYQLTDYKLLTDWELEFCQIMISHWQKLLTG